MGSSSGAGGAVPVSWATESKARELKSRGRLGVRDRFGMPYVSTRVATTDFDVSGRRELVGVVGLVLAFAFGLLLTFLLLSLHLV
jgi:hypothetical protein